MMPNLPSADAVLFDFDGVIIDSRGPVRAAFNATLRDHGYDPRPGPELDTFIGPGTHTALAELTGAEDLGPLIDSYHDHYRAVYLATTTLMPGIGAVLAGAELPLALATAKQAEFTTPLLEELGIAQCFTVVCAPSLAQLEEPKSHTVARALEQLGTTNAIMIGDRLYDVDAAHANGIAAVGVTWGIGDRAELERAGAELILERPEELGPLLRRR